MTLREYLKEKVNLKSILKILKQKFPIRNNAINYLQSKHTWATQNKKEKDIMIVDVKMTRDEIDDLIVMVDDLDKY